MRGTRTCKNYHAKAFEMLIQSYQQKHWNWMQSTSNKLRQCVSNIKSNWNDKVKLGEL